MQYIIPQEDYIHGGTQKDVYRATEVEFCDCPLCGSKNYTRIYTERENLGTVICASCGLLYTNPRSNSAEENYFGDTNVFYQESLLIFRGKKSHHRDRNYIYELNEIKRHVPKGKLLDIGSNMGFFLRKAVEMGFDCHGVEPSPSLAKISEKEFGLKITNAFFEDANFGDKSFDIITLIDVFEHVTQPKQMLKEAHRVLSDKGILCIKVPNGNYNLLKLKLARLTGKTSEHDIFNSFEHVVHYTHPTMKQMVESCGFKIKKLVVPIPIQIPVWHQHVGHYFAYPSPFILDAKRIMLRNMFYYIGKVQKALGFKITCGPDLMFIVDKK
jgi:2-polyprenyl-3-methyl-5-hydroxy-6-metoxy-1,4-benzoquinol methylase/predicted RNA-binding Zn-ribbon protein involved in translation (DUF1610 family)